MSGTAPANQLRLSFTGSEDGEAETETCRAAKPLWRTTNRTSGPHGLNLLNRRMRTRLYDLSAFSGVRRRESKSGTRKSGEPLGGTDKPTFRPARAQLAEPPYADPPV